MKNITQKLFVKSLLCGLFCVANFGAGQAMPVRWAVDDERLNALMRRALVPVDERVDVSEESAEDGPSVARRRSALDAQDGELDSEAPALIEAVMENVRARPADLQATICIQGERSYFSNSNITTREPFPWENGGGIDIFMVLMRQQ